MNTEQKTNIQEVAKEDYTKVYGGINFLPLEDFYTILPIGPIKPKKPEVDRQT
tara:strand:- start:1071 stop:1229 length:159 start_codon:yes stop_codon:yes gene_type:complete